MELRWCKLRNGIASVLLDFVRKVELSAEREESVHELGPGSRAARREEGQFVPPPTAKECAGRESSPTWDEAAKSQSMTSRVEPRPASTNAGLRTHQCTTILGKDILGVKWQTEVCGGGRASSASSGFKVAVGNLKFPRL